MVAWHHLKVADSIPPLTNPAIIGKTHRPSPAIQGKAVEICESLRDFNLFEYDIANDNDDIKGGPQVPRFKS